MLELPPYPKIKNDLTRLAKQLDIVEPKFRKYSLAATRITYAISLIDDLKNLLTPISTSTRNYVDLEHINLLKAFIRLEYYLLCSSDTLKMCVEPLKETLSTLHDRVGANYARIKSLFISSNSNLTGDFKMIFIHFMGKLKAIAPPDILGTVPARQKSIFCCIKKPIPNELEYHDITDTQLADEKVKKLLHMPAHATINDIYQQVCFCLELFEVGCKPSDKFVHLVLTLYLNLVHCLSTTPALLDSVYKEKIDNREAVYDLKNLVLTQLADKGNRLIENYQCVVIKADGEHTKSFSALCTGCGSGVCDACYQPKIKYCHVCNTNRLQWIPLDLLPWAQPTDSRHTTLQYNDGQVETADSNTRLKISTHDAVTPDELRLAQEEYGNLRRGVNSNTGEVATTWGNATFTNPS